MTVVEWLEITIVILCAAAFGALGWARHHFYDAGYRDGQVDAMNKARRIVAHLRAYD